MNDYLHRLARLRTDANRTRLTHSMEVAQI